MKSQYDKLNDMLNMKQTESGINKTSKVYRALCDILRYGKAYTGESGRKYYHVYTWEVSHHLTKIGVKHICGNEAPRGGANGEYVQVTSKAMIKRIKEERSK